MKNEKWVIVHDNGVPGKKGFSDGYTSKEECLSALERMENNGITVYEFWRSE